MNLISIIGKKGSGKSEVLEALISRLAGKGYRIGVLKRLAKDNVEIDEPGKNTYRYRAQGAGTVVLAGRKRMALFSNLSEEPALENLLAFFPGFDLVFLEGYSRDGILKIEVEGAWSAEELDQKAAFIEGHLINRKVKMSP